MNHPLFAKVLSVFGSGPRDSRRGAALLEVVQDDEPDLDLDLFALTPGRAGKDGSDDSLDGCCYRMGGELVTILKDGTNALVRGDRAPTTWYEPRSVVLDNLSRHELAKPACSSSGFWYDVAQVPQAEHFAVQNKKPPGAPRHWMQA